MRKIEFQHEWAEAFASSCVGISVIANFRFIIGIKFRISQMGDVFLKLCATQIQPNSKKKRREKSLYLIFYGYTMNRADECIDSPSMAYCCSECIPMWIGGDGYYGTDLLLLPPRLCYFITNELFSSGHFV